MANKIDIGGELHSVATDHKVADASEIKDISKGNKSQAAFNDDVDRHEVEIHGTGGIDSRLTDVEQIEQIVLNGGEAQIAQGSDFTNPDATKRAKIPTVGAIVDGLNDGVYDVSKRNPTAGLNSDGKFTLDYILDNANTLIPTSWRHGGMIISFVHSSDNKYIQYFLAKNEWSASEADWHKMNLEEEVSQLEQKPDIIHIINTDFSIAGLVQVNGTIVDHPDSPYRRTSPFLIKAHNAVSAFVYADSTGASLLSVFSDAQCTIPIALYAGEDEMTSPKYYSFFNNSDSDVYIILTTKSPFVENSFGLYGADLFVSKITDAIRTDIDTIENIIINTIDISIDSIFVNPGIVQNNGTIINAPDSSYRMTEPILLKYGKRIKVHAYGSSELNPIAVFGDNLLTKFQRVINGIALEQGEDYGFGTFSYENKSGFDMYIICTTHNSKQDESWYKIDDVPFENNNIILDIADIYKEHGVCLWTTKTYSYNALSLYVTRFIPVKENQLVYFYNGSYPSTFEVFACNAEKQYIESIINLRGSEDNGDLVKHYLTIKVPQGVNYIGVTNREDELINPQLKVYKENIYANAKIRPIIKDYNLSPQKGHIAFVIDGGYDADDTLKDVFDQKGIKAGWAPLFPQYMADNHGMDIHMDWYMNWQNEGHEILTHSGSAIVWNDVNYSVPSNPIAQAAFAKMRIEQFRNIGFITRGFVQLGSQVFSTEEARKPIYNSYEYGFTRATNTITEPDQGAVMMPTDKPWNLGRSTLEVITLEQMKSLIDECANKKGFLCIYCHSWRIGNQQYPNQTWETMAEMMDYALSKCVVDIPYNCIKALYANHIE